MEESGEMIQYGNMVGFASNDDPLSRMIDELQHGVVAGRCLESYDNYWSTAKLIGTHG
jgi:hypothetical protein